MSSVLSLKSWSMANRPAPALVLRVGDRVELERWARASMVTASAAKRARIVLLAADGVANTRIAELVDVTVTTVVVAHSLSGQGAGWPGGSTAIWSPADP